jgi:hypothetical protein
VSSNPWHHQGKAVYVQVIFICMVLEFNGDPTLAESRSE